MIFGIGVPVAGFLAFLNYAFKGLFDGNKGNYYLSSTIVGLYQQQLFVLLWIVTVYVAHQIAECKQLEI